MFGLILKHIGNHKAQVASIVLLIATGTLLMYALALYSIGAYRGVTLAEERSGADVMLVSEGAISEVSDSALLFTGVPYHEYINADIEGRAKKISGVAHTSSQFFAETLAMACCTPDVQTRIVGVDFSSDWTLQSLTSLDLQKGLGENEVLVGARVADNPDGTITLHGTRYKIVDRLASTGSDIDLCVIADIETVRDYATELDIYDHYWEEFGNPEEIVSAVLIDLDDGLSEEQKKVTIRLLDKIPNCRTVVRSETMQAAEDSIRVFLEIMMLATVAITAVGLVQLIARFSSMAWDRRSEFAIYRILGASRKHLAFLVCGEAVLITSASVAAGLVLGVVFYDVSSDWLFAGTSFPFVPPSIGLMLAVGACVIVLWLLITLASILAPLRQINRSQAALVMKQNDIV